MLRLMRKKGVDGKFEEGVGLMVAMDECLRRWEMKLKVEVENKKMNIKTRIKNIKKKQKQKIRFNLDSTLFDPSDIIPSHTSHHKITSHMSLIYIHTQRDRDRTKL